MRTYTTIENQTIYDLCIQNFGGLDDIDELMRSSPDLNEALPTNAVLTLSDTEDELANRFEVNDVKFATGLEFDTDVIAGGFEYEFELEFQG